MKRIELGNWRVWAVIPVLLAWAGSACVPTFDAKTCPQKTQEKPAADTSAEGDIAAAAKTEGKEDEATKEFNKRLNSWDYTRVNKNDPFTPITIESGVEASGHQTFSVEQMMLVGSVVSKARAESVAFIKLPDGNDLIVREGDIIGKNNGIVKQIREDGVVIEEVFVKPDDKDPTIWVVVYFDKLLPLVKVVE